jgi:Rad3-related DNA helicase
MSILDYFPYSAQITKIRPLQEKALLQVEELIKNDKKRIIISAPVGSGKSAVGICIAEWLRVMGYTTIYTSPENTLVAQMQRTQSDHVKTIMGKSNYPCHIAKDIGKKHSCDDSFCAMKKCGTQIHELIKQGAKSIVMPPRDCRSCKLSCMCNKCYFKKAMLDYKGASIGNTNFTMFQMGVKEASCFIIDESEKSEGFIRLHRSIVVREKWPRGLEWRQYMDMIVEVVAEKRRALKQLEKQSQNINDEYALKKIAREMKALDREIDRASGIIEDYAIFQEEWIPIFENDSVRFEPITVSRFFEGMFQENDIVILMSATPIVYDGWDLVELPSMFDVEIRPWKYQPAGPMNYQEREMHSVKMAAQILQLRRERPGKILVHCHAYGIAHLLRNKLTALGCKNILMQTSSKKAEEDEATRKEFIETFLNRKDDCIALTVNLHSGIDLWEYEGDRQVNTQVIAKVPFINPNDPIYLAKQRVLGKELTELEYNKSMAAVVQQAYGRINRNDLKNTLTVIMDGSWYRFFKSNKIQFRNYFLEAELK